MIKDKICPFAATNPNAKHLFCIGENCALYIRIAKQIDPITLKTYEGCGLVRQVPWQIKLIVRTPEMRQAQAAYAKLEAKTR